MARLYYFKGAKPNFGDELNPWLWPRLLPDLLDDNDDELFLGIGTILNDGVPAPPKKIVFGSGFGYGLPPRVDSAKWDIYCVRGPLTAHTLGLPEELAVCDPAILLRRQPWPTQNKQYQASFMPHWESLSRGNWPQACAEADIHFIDPTAPIEQVVREIRGSELLITEAMHGAIVADAMRVPWVPVQPQLHMHSPKWLDWCASVEVPYLPQQLRASSFIESTEATYRRARQHLSHTARTIKQQLHRQLPPPSTPADQSAPQNPSTTRAKTLKFLELFVERPAAAVAKAIPHSFKNKIDESFIREAARDLHSICRVRPSLSTDATIERVTERLETCLDSVKKTI